MIANKYILCTYEIMIKIVYLRHFIAAAETASFSSAAAKLNISTTSIRNSIEKLEASLNITLFVRKPANGVFLTSDGRKLLAQSKDFLNSVDDIEGSFISKHRKLRGNLTIGCQEGLTWSLIPRAINKINEVHPELNISVKTVWMDTQFESLDQAEVDVLVTFFIQKDLPQKYSITDLCSPQACVMMRKGHPLDNGKSIALKDLALFPHIFIKDGPAWELFYGMYQERGLDPEIFMFSNISTGAQAVIGRTDAVSLRILRPDNPLTPMGDPMVVPVIKDVVLRPRLLAATNKIKRPRTLDKRTAFINICQDLFDDGDMKAHVYY